VDGHLEGVTDVLVFHEILCSLRKRFGLKKSLEVFDSVSCIISVIFNITPDDMFMARELVEKYPEATYRDLLHVAIISNNDIERICTTDKDFLKFEELNCLNPLDFPGEEGV